MKNPIILATALVLSMAAGATFACEGMGPSKHVGQLLTVDATKHTFTIQDAQSRSPITFTANNEIIDGLKGYSGNLMVNYTEDDAGLTAVGVTF